MLFLKHPQTFKHHFEPEHHIFKTTIRTTSVVIFHEDRWSIHGTCFEPFQKRFKKDSHPYLRNFLMCFHLCMISESLLYDRQTSKCYVYMIHEHRAVFLRKDKFSAEYNFSLMELVYIIGRTCQIWASYYHKESFRAR